MNHIIASIDTDRRNYSHVEKLLDEGYELLNVAPAEGKIFFILRKKEETNDQL